MSTPHNEAKKGDFAKVVLMPGDPYRAKWIAETFLHDVVCVNQVRGMLAFTGLTKNNVKISVMASGMGNPSIGIYSRELFKEYDVETIIRVGTCGSYQKDVELCDIVLASAASSDSNWMSQYHLNGTFSAVADFETLMVARDVLRNRNERYHVGNVFASDVFYDVDENNWKKWAALGVLAVEMESHALYVNALEMHKKALTILTVSDSFVCNSKLSSQERQTGLIKMVEIAIETAEKLS